MGSDFGPGDFRDVRGWDADRLKLRKQFANPHAAGLAALWDVWFHRMCIDPKILETCSFPAMPTIGTQR
jgi:hypothetical protein